MKLVMNLRPAVLLLLVALVLPGCSWLGGENGWFRDRQADYRLARPSPVPKVPEDLSDQAIGEAMFIPEVPGMDRYLAQEEFELPRPTTLFAREEDRGVRIQSFGTESWVVAPDPPSLVWPRILQFLADNGVAVDREQPEAGILESQWIEIGDERYRDVVRSVLSADAGDSRQHRLRVQVGQAVRQGATEIDITHLGAERAREVEWPESSTSASAEAALLAELAGYLAAEVGQSGISLRAQTIAAEPKAEVFNDRDLPPVLRLRLDYDRAWATVSTALNNAEIAILEQDAQEGIYRINYDENQFSGEEPGWFRRTFSFAFRSPGAQTYTLKLEPGDGGFLLRVLTPEGGVAADREQSEQVLSIIREFAS